MESGASGWPIFHSLQLFFPGLRSPYPNYEKFWEALAILQTICCVPGAQC